MRSLYPSLLLLAAATPLLADEQSECMAKASPTNGVIFWSTDGLEVPLDKGDSDGGIMPGSSGTTAGCMQLGLWDGQIRIGKQPDLGNPPVLARDTRSIVETNPNGTTGWATYDVSYILGFSYPIVCKDTVQLTLTGDNLDLFNATDGAPCEEMNGYTCVNPVGPAGIHGTEMGANDGNTCWNCNPPNPFFAPVAGAAYTFPNDDGTVISKSSNAIVCCVGPQCPWSNPKAGSTKGGTCSCDSGTDKRDSTPESKPKSKTHIHGHGIHKARGLSEVI